MLNAPLSLKVLAIRAVCGDHIVLPTAFQLSLFDVRRRQNSDAVLVQATPPATSHLEGCTNRAGGLADGAMYSAVVVTY